MFVLLRDERLAQQHHARAGVSPQMPVSVNTFSSFVQQDVRQGTVHGNASEVFSRGHRGCFARQRFHD